MDQASVLSALGVFLLSGGADVCSLEPLHSRCLQRFSAAMDAKDPLVSTTAALTGHHNWDMVSEDLQKMVHVLNVDQAGPASLLRPAGGCWLNWDHLCHMTSDGPADAQTQL